MILLMFLSVYCVYYLLISKIVKFFVFCLSVVFKKRCIICIMRFSLVNCVSVSVCIG